MEIKTRIWSPDKTIVRLPLSKCDLSDPNHAGFVTFTGFYWHDAICIIATMRNTLREKITGCDLEHTRQMPAIGQMKLVLSLFPGIDLLGRGFEAEGFAVVRGPDKILGQLIEDFHTVPGRFDGVIGGSPCNEFSGMRRQKATGYGIGMLKQFVRVVREAQPYWWLLENVPGSPDIAIPGYTVQRFMLSAADSGLKQSRNRYFQFGSCQGLSLVIKRKPARKKLHKICLASEGKSSTRRTWSQFVTLMGLPSSFDLPGLSLALKYRLVGQGVPIPMAQTIARAIKTAKVLAVDARICPCGCGRLLSGRQKSATPACRKRLQRRNS